jgi:hypothetical protein
MAVDQDRNRKVGYRDAYRHMRKNLGDGAPGAGTVAMLLVLLALLVGAFVWSANRQEVLPDSTKTGTPAHTNR